MSRIHPDMSSVCLITGASSGIGAALAREFARHGHALVLTARREAELTRLAEEIARTGAPRPDVVAADIAKPEGADGLVRGLSERGLTVSILVNNAGYGLLGEAAKLDLQQQLGMIDLNVRALTDLTLRFVNGIVRQKGGILNVASIASFLPGPGMTIYHATKAYVLSFTEALYGELVPQGVKVCALCPGPVPTPFLTNAGIPHDYFPRFLARSADRVARAGYEGFMAGRRVVVPGAPNRVLTLLPRLIPRGLIAEASAWRWRNR